MADMSKPYSHEDYQAINDWLRKLNESKAALDKATSASINCQDWPAICDDMIARFTSLKATYFPDRP